MNVTKEWLERMRSRYPSGSRVKLYSMGNDPRPIADGESGTLEYIDDIGTFHVKWDNGRMLGLIFGEDDFSVTPPEPTMVKLYMPLHADFAENGYEYDDTDLLNGRSLVRYEDNIIAALTKYRMPEEAERGLMRWYGDDDSVNAKVKSAVFTAETRDHKLWGVAECRVIGTLSAEEMTKLKEYISGQASDGWGEGFEQQEIRVADGELYVHLWDFGDWDILTEEERFGPKYAEGLPEMCFSTLKSTGELICIKRGESGYYPSDWSTNDPEQNKKLADYNNEHLGVTDAQRKAMEVGSMHGWNVPGADPATYESHEQQTGGMNLEPNL